MQSLLLTFCCVVCVQCCALFLAPTNETGLKNPAYLRKLSGGFLACTVNLQANRPDVNCVTASRTIRYIDWDPQRLLRPPTIYWNDATWFSAILIPVCDMQTVSMCRQCRDDGCVRHSFFSKIRSPVGAREGRPHASVWRSANVNDGSVQYPCLKGRGESAMESLDRAFSNVCRLCKYSVDIVRLWYTLQILGVETRELNLGKTVSVKCRRL